MEKVNRDHPIPNNRRSGAPDSAIMGFIAGIAATLLGIIVLYFFWGNGDFKTYFSEFTRFGTSLYMERSSKIISLAMIANLIPFYFFLNKRKYLSTRGVLIAAFLFVVLIILYKFVWQ